jgi:PAS domain S-box-containing protein
MRTTDEARPSVGHAEQLFEFETLVSELSSRFINLRPGEVDGAIEDALCRVCEPLGIDMAMLWQWSDLTPGVATATHVYTREGVPAPGLPHQAQFPWHSQELLAGRTVALSSLDALPAAAAVDRENGRLVGIQSSLALPLAIGTNQSIGVLGLSTVHARRDWPDALVKRLQLVAQVFTNALARERQEHRLLQSQARLAASAELADLAFYEVDFVAGVAHADERLRDLCGIPADCLQGLQPLEFWMEHIHPDDRERVLALRQELHAGALERLVVEYRFPHPIRGERCIHHVARVARRDATGRALSTFGVLRDITEAKRAEEALRELSRRLIQAHEDERALLARELHDDVTQRLAVLAIDVGRAELVVPAGGDADVMRSVREELVRLSEDIHSLAYQLHPSVLEELGLVEALRAECERRGRQGRLSVALDLDSRSAVAAKDAELCLFRVAQEALTNVVRHARTPVATLTLRQAGGGLLLAISDRGVGFDPASPQEGRSLGLASMRERVHLVNGTLDVEAAPGRGTTIVAWVPAHGREGPAP